MNISSKFPQNGTYWYHSHSGLQEQIGHYGPIVIEPKGPDPVAFDREYVVVLSDWPSANPERVFAKLKKQSDNFNFQRRTVGDFFRDASNGDLKERMMWGQMRMSPTDIADVHWRRIHLPDQRTLPDGELDGSVRTGAATPAAYRQRIRDDSVRRAIPASANDGRAVGRSERQAS